MEILQLSIAGIKVVMAVMLVLIVGCAFVIGSCFRDFVSWAKGEEQ